MKYFIQYPIYLDCNLKCTYCFHNGKTDRNPEDTDEQYIAKLNGGPNFSVEEYITWRATHLYDGKELVVHFHGGEPTVKRNIELITEFLDKSAIEKLDVLSNGLGPEESYDKLLEYKDRIFRFGLTFHREIIERSTDIRKKFCKTAFKLRDSGIPLYIKELLILKYKPQLLSNKAFWEAQGVEFRIQDFKGYVRGQDFSDFDRYTIDDINLIHHEFIKTGSFCSCLPGYKQIMIRGGWMAGDVLGCWIDPTVVGNIKENTFNPNYKVHLDYKNNRTEVIGVPKLYRGTYNGDRWDPNSIQKEPIC